MTLRLIEGGAQGKSLKRTIAGSGLVDYIWLDPDGRFKIQKRAIAIVFGGAPGDATDLVPIIPPWSITTKNLGRIVLHACYYLPDPLRPQPSYLALCEVRDENNHSHPSNTRAVLRDQVDQVGGALNVEGNAILDRLGTIWGFGESFQICGSPPTHDDAESRQAAERFLGACLDAGIMIHSVDFNDSTGYCTYNIGHRGLPTEIDPDPATALVIADHLTLARYLLEKVMWDVGLTVSFNRCWMYLSTHKSREEGSAQSLVDTLLEHLNIPELPDLNPGFSLGLNAETGKTDHLKYEGLEALEDPYLFAAKILAILGEPKEESE